MSFDVDVLVMGSGAGAILTALRLADRGFSVAIADSRPWAHHASAGNQGWLQSGTLFAGDTKARDICKEGYSEIMSRYPDCTYGVRSFYYFGEPEDLDGFVQSCNRFGIWARATTYESVVDAESLVQGSRFDLFAEVKDRCFSPTLLLQRALSETSARSLVRFLLVGNSAQVKEKNNGWAIDHETGDLTASLLVIANGAGPLPFDIPGVPTRTNTLWCLSVQGSYISTILAGPSVESSANVVPWFGDGAGGFTVTLNGQENTAEGTFKSRVGSRLNAAIPGLRSLLGAESAPARIYSCKVWGGPRNFVTAVKKGLYLLYPHKLTMAPSLALSLAATIGDQFTPKGVVPPHLSDTPPPITGRRALNSMVTHRIRRDGDELIVEAVE